MKHLTLLLFLVTLSGCTVIRYVDNNRNNGEDGPPPKIVDMLVLVEMERGTANLTEDVGTIIISLQTALQQQKVNIRKTAMAPMYGRSEGVVPILYGEEDEASEFSSFAGAIFFYTQDDGVSYLRDHATADTENLAALGQTLDQRAVYRPTAADPEARAFFDEAADGFIVVHIATSPRRCDASDEACSSVEGMSPVDYFTEQSDGEVADWLSLAAGSGVPKNRIFHAVIATQEGIDYDAFYESCTAFPNFPATKLDVMEPSNNVFFTSFASGIRDRGGEAEFVDICETMSSQGPLALGQLSVKIRGMF